jgi:hypothetical protein
MKNVEEKKQIKDSTMNIVFIFIMHMSNKSTNNNCKNVGFGMQRSKDDMLRILAKSVVVFT